MGLMTAEIAVFEKFVRLLLPPLTAATVRVGPTLGAEVRTGPDTVQIGRLVMTGGCLFMPGHPTFSVGGAVEAGSNGLITTTGYVLYHCISV